MDGQSETFGKALRRLRRQASFSQEELAQRAGIDFTYISKLENDRVPPPSEDTIVKLCEVMAALPDELLIISRKVPRDVRNLITTSPGALEFLRAANSMDLTEQEWARMVRALKRVKKLAEY